MESNRASISCIPILMRLPSSLSNPLLRLATLSARSASLQSVIGKPVLAAALSELCAKSKSDEPMLLAAFGPGLGDNLDHLFVPISRFLSGFRLPL